jgi:pimeloyl-ACP methyl ester carboxylesterase
MPFFKFDDQRLAYTVYGEGSRWCVLLHGQLLSQTMQRQLAVALADRGHRIVTFDCLGHGQSDRPNDMWRYSMSQFGEQTIALLDHLEVPRAVIAGTSMGANAALEVAAQAPDRVQGLVIEMPVLEDGLLAAILTFHPILLAFLIAKPVVRSIGGLARRIPRQRLPLLGEVVLETVAQDHDASAAVLLGMVYGRTAPHRSIRRKLDAPALVIAHRRDNLHPFSDAERLVREMPSARLLEAESIFELRARPERLTAEIAEFLDECWEPERARRPRRRGAQGARRRPMLKAEDVTNGRARAR